MVEPERAFFLTNLPGEPPQGCSRLYYGAEFCYWRLPSTRNILSAREWAQIHNLPFTLVTPTLGEDERQRFATILQQLLPELDSADEVLISDWGALELVREVRSDLEVILGRTLSGQKRGPRILDMELTPAQRDYFQRGSWYGHEAARLLADKDIRRVELDNLLQGVAPLPEGLHGSLHVPYAMVTSSRSCPFRSAGSFGPCPVHCGELFTLKTSETAVLLYQNGNTQFLMHETLPVQLSELNIDRIVSSSPV